MCYHPDDERLAKKLARELGARNILCFESLNDVESDLQQKVCSPRHVHLPSNSNPSYTCFCLLSVPQHISTSLFSLSLLFSLFSLSFVVSMKWGGIRFTEQIHWCRRCGVSSWLTHCLVDTAKFRLNLSTFQCIKQSKSQLYPASCVCGCYSAQQYSES